MSKWISKAANVFKRDVEETAQPFELHCECGQKHRGLRRSRHQHLVCKSCGASTFVLPRDVYPPPHERKQSKKKRAKTKPGSSSQMPVGQDEQLLDDVVVLEKTAPRHRTQKQVDIDDEVVPRKRKKSKQKDAAPPEPPQPGFLERTREQLKDAIRGFFQFWTPFRLALFGIMIFAGFAVAWSIIEGRRSLAASSIKKHTEAGKDAVAVEDWIAARRAFEQAVNALDILNRNDPEAVGIRRYYSETQALTNLSLISIFELLENASSIHKKEGAEGWQQKFFANQGDWMVITGPVERTLSKVGEDETEHLELYFPWTPPGAEKVRIRADFADLEEIVPSDTHIEVTFAGELASCEFIESEKTWVVTLDPQTGIAWCHADTYAGLKFETNEIDTEEAVNSRLSRQADAIGAKQ